LGVTSLFWCLVKLDLLLILIGDGTAAIYACMCLAALKGRSGAAAHAPYRMPAFPLVPILALSALAAVGAADLFDPDGRKGLMAAAAAIVLAAAYYRLVVKPRGVWAHRGPGADGRDRRDKGGPSA